MVVGGGGVGKREKKEKRGPNKRWGREGGMGCLTVAPHTDATLEAAPSKTID